jgi:N-glycosylase/DNA lyase
MSRAKYIIGTVEALQSKSCGGLQWLAALRKLDLEEVVDALATLPGVGPKVAACIALFSLDQHHAIPVDTHVWQVTPDVIIFLVYRYVAAVFGGTFFLNLFLQ